MTKEYLKRLNYKKIALLVGFLPILASIILSVPFFQTLLTIAWQYIEGLFLEGNAVEFYPQRCVGNLIIRRKIYLLYVPGSYGPGDKVFVLLYFFCVTFGFLQGILQLGKKNICFYFVLAIIFGIGLIGLHSIVLMDELIFVLFLSLGVTLLLIFVLDD